MPITAVTVARVRQATDPVAGNQHRVDQLFSVISDVATRNLDLPLLKEFGATGDGIADDGPALAALPAGTYLGTSGTYRVAANTALPANVRLFMMGGVLAPTGGVTVTLGAGAAIVHDGTGIGGAGTVAQGTGSLLRIGSGGGLRLVSTKTGAYAVGADEDVPVDSTSASFNVTLAATPAAFQRARVFDRTGQTASHPVTILPGNVAHGLPGGGTSLLLDDGTGIEIYWDATQTAWVEVLPAATGAATAISGLSMTTLTITANGTYALGTDPPSLAGCYVAVGVAAGASLAGGVLALQYSPDQGTTWETLEGLGAMLPGNDRTVQWPGARFRLSLSGATVSPAPAITVYWTFAN